MDRESELILAKLMQSRPSGRYYEQGGMTKIGYSDLYPKAAAWVNSGKTPTEVSLNPNNPSNIPLRDILVHENQHVLDNLRNYTPVSWTKPFLRDEAPSDANYVDTSKDFDTLYNNIKSTYEKYKDKYNLSLDYKENGLVAELKRIESTLPPGMNIFDTDIGKEVSKDLPNFKLAYFDQSRPYKGTYMYSADTADKASNFTYKNLEPKTLKRKAIETLKQYFGL